MNSVGHLETLAYLTCMYDHFISDFEISLYDYTYVFFFFTYFFFPAVKQSAGCLFQCPVDCLKILMQMCLFVNNDDHSWVVRDPHGGQNHRVFLWCCRTGLKWMVLSSLCPSLLLPSALPPFLHSLHSSLGGHFWHLLKPLELYSVW